MSVNILENKSYFMFNKPAGCITARTDLRHKTVMEYFSDLNNPELHPMGRLDKDTEGLLIITDDGKFNQAIMHPENHIPKVYEFIALGTLPDSERLRLENGIYLTSEDEATGKLTKPCKILISKNSILSEVDKSKIHDSHHTKLFRNRPDHPVCYGSITITEGKKHHVKRLLRAGGLCVIGLKRTAIGRLKLDKNLNPGQFRPLTYDELSLFKDTN